MTEQTAPPVDERTAEEKLMAAFSDVGLDAKIESVLEYNQFQRSMAMQAMQDEVVELCGPFRSRDRTHARRYRRHGTNPGSIRIQGQRVPVRVPRVRDMQTSKERPLETYRIFHDAPVDEDALVELLLAGVSQRRYRATALKYADAFGLSDASVRRVFIRRSEAIMQEFFARDLGEYDLVGLWIDGKHFGKHQVIVAMGLTVTGEKIVLGFAQVPSESNEVIQGLLEDLIDRGLRFQQGLLCMVDGSKGIHAAVKAVFGRYVQVQRCCWHKRENVLAHVKEEDKEQYKDRLQKAYRRPNYDEAKADLLTIHAELETHAPKAARSLAEGMEETLTVHRLGVNEDLGRSLRTTNCIENHNSSISRLVRNVSHWQNSAQVHRWVALAAQRSVLHLRQIPQATHLPKLRAALQETLGLAHPYKASDRLSETPFSN